MFMLNIIVSLLVYLLLLPLRTFSRITERMIETPRDGGWETGFADQARLALATGATLRQAQLYTAYPGAAHRAMQTLRILGIR